MESFWMSKKIEEPLERSGLCYFSKCNTIFGIITFVRVFLKGFKIAKYKFLPYLLLNTFNKSCENFLICQKGEVVGCFCIYTTIDIEEKLSYVYLYDFCILEGYRRKGIGTDALKGILNYVEYLGYDELGLNVREDNKIAFLLYDKFGFEKDEEINSIMCN